jgi:hypothetical protein
MAGMEGTNEDQTTKQITKRELNYHRVKYESNFSEPKSAAEVYATVKNNGAPSGVTEIEHANTLFQKKKSVEYYEAKTNANLASIHALENNQKLPGPKRRGKKKKE